MKNVSAVMELRGVIARLRWAAVIGAFLLGGLLLSLCAARAENPWIKAKTDEETKADKQGQADKQTPRVRWGGGEAKQTSPVPAPASTPATVAPGNGNRWQPRRTDPAPRPEFNAPVRERDREVVTPAPARNWGGNREAASAPAPVRNWSRNNEEPTSGRRLPGYGSISAPKPAAPVWKPVPQVQNESSRRVASPQVRSWSPNPSLGSEDRRPVTTGENPFLRNKRDGRSAATEESKANADATAPALPWRRAQPAVKAPVLERKIEAPKFGRTEPNRTVGNGPVIAARPQFTRTAIPKEQRWGSEEKPMLRGADFLRKLRTETQTQSRVFASNPKSFVRLGGLKPSDVTVFRGRATNRDLNLSYTRLVDHFGAPAYNYAVVPLRHSDFTTGYRTGYRDGFHDGYREGRHEPFHRHRSVFSISLFFGGYYNDPSWGFFWNPGYYPAAYAYYGWSPRWIYPERVVVVPADYIYWPRTYYYDTQPALDYRGVRDAVSDLREGWYEADMNRFARHLRDDVQIRVYFDGEYKYSVSAEDYSAMTLDTLSTTRTLKFNLDDPIWLSPYEVFLTGRHVIADPDGERSTVYVSYRLRRIAGEWYVIAVGTSLNPIEHQYTDFRGDNAYSGRVAYSRDDDY